MNRLAFVTEIAGKLGMDQLSPREKLVLAVGGLLVVVFLGYQLLVHPYMDARSRLLDVIERKDKELGEMRQLRKKLLNLQAEEGGIKSHLAKRDPQFTLFTFLDRQAESAKVKSLIKYMKPSTSPGENGELSESMVEMKIEGISFEQLLTFLDATESTEHVVTVRRLSVQIGTGDIETLDVLLQVVTYSEAG